MMIEATLTLAALIPLAGYAVHGKACPVRWQQPGDCRCGLTALIKEIDGE